MDRHGGWAWTGTSSLLTWLPVVFCKVHAGEPCSQLQSKLMACIGHHPVLQVGVPEGFRLGDPVQQL